MADQRRDKNRMLKPGASSTRESFKEETGGIDQNLLEKRLESLRDTQESVQGLSLWCQANKRHSSAIIETWLKILKKSPVEKRLTLFYLANDVVQHAKRKSDAMVVNQWAFAVQKATPQVRIPSSVSTAIARIFKIWEERSVYSKETISDLLALLNNVPAKERVGEKKKPETYTASADKVAAFQTPTLISKVKLAYRLKSHLGVTFRAKPFVHMDLENLKGSIKDRSHGMEVIQEIGQLVEQLKTSESKLSIEVEERRKIVETAEVAIVHFEIVRGEAKIVNSAYKNFTERVESTKDKVIEKFKSFEEMEIDSSPVPSPPPEAPSPPPDDDDFGINQLQSTSSSTHIRADIVDALKSTMHPTTAVQQNNSGGMYQTANSNSQQQQPSTNSLSAYDQTIPSLAIQQQFQQNWGTSPGNFAAIIQQLIPGANNYLAMQQQQQPPLTNTYGTQGYDAPYQHHHTSPPTHLPPDVSSIPLPPSGPDIPPPPQNQTMNSNHHHMSVQNNSINSPVGSNPYLSYNNSSYDSSSSTPAVDEYVPLPYYKPQQQQHEQNLNSSMNYSSEFDSYNITSANAPSTTPTRQGPSRYHPYQHASDSSISHNSSGGQHGNSHLVSPAYSNHSGVGSGSMNESSTSRFYGSGGGISDGGNSTISPPIGRNDKGPSSSFDPMEMFTSALNKNKNNTTQGSSQPPPSGDMNMGANSAFNPADSFYSSGNIFDTSFNESNTSNLNGGEDVVPYSPRKPGTGNFFTPHRGSVQHGVLGGNNFSNNNRPPRGHRGGMRGGLQMSRGFSGGFRGRGTPRGPPRGGRGRFQV